MSNCDVSTGCVNYVLIMLIKQKGAKSNFSICAFANCLWSYFTSLSCFCQYAQEFSDIYINPAAILNEIYPFLIFYNFTAVKCTGKLYKIFSNYYPHLYQTVIFECFYPCSVCSLGYKIIFNIYILI